MDKERVKTDNEYIVSVTDEITLNVTDGKIDAYRETQESSSTARVYAEGKIGVAGELGKADKDKLFAQAEKSLEKGIPYAAKLNKNVKKIVEVKKSVVDKDKLLKTAAGLCRRVAKACPKFLINGKVQLTNNTKTYENSENTQLKFGGSSLGVSFEIKDRESSNIADLAYGASFNRYGKSVADKIVADLTALHENFYKKTKLEDGEYPIIIGTFDIFGHIFKDFVAEYYVSNGSLLSGKLGQKIFDERLSVYVDRNPKTNFTSPFFDAEGEIAADFRAPLVVNGVMKGVLDTKNTAKLYNLPLCKCAEASYDGVPGAGLGGLYVKPTADNIADLTGDKKAIFVAITSGGDITTEGVLGLPVQLAFLVENGRISARVSDFSISGNIFDFLGKSFLGTVKHGVYAASLSEMLVFNAKIINS